MHRIRKPFFPLTLLALLGVCLMAPDLRSSGAALAWGADGGVAFEDQVQGQNETDAVITPIVVDPASAAQPEQAEAAERAVVVKLAEAVATTTTATAAPTLTAAPMPTAAAAGASNLVPMPTATALPIPDASGLSTRGASVDRSISIDRSAYLQALPTATPVPEPTLPPVLTKLGDSLTSYTAKESTSSASTASGNGKSYNGYAAGRRVTVTVTHYCPCATCNGSKNAGIAANGQRLSSGMAALNWLPLGSIVEVNGKRYTITDRGVGSGRIDLFVSSHSLAYQLGKFKATLTIIRVGK